MPAPVRLIQTVRVVVISPSDVKDERIALGDVIQELNRTVAKAYGVHLELWAWEMDSFPGFHNLGPQGLIDELLLQNDPDIVVGIFWHRIGTALPAGPGAETATGTTHEFQEFYSRWKDVGCPQILFYFKQEPYFPRDRHDLTQWDGVFQFKEKFPVTGFSWDFGDTRQFETLVRNHLAMALVQKYGGTFAKGVAIVDTKRDLTNALLEIIAKAEKYLLTTGSRSHDATYLGAIEKRIKENPELRYYRVLFGQPHHRDLKAHLVRMMKGRAGRPRGRNTHETVFITLFNETDRQAEVSLCANETQALVVLPSFNEFGTFDSAIIFTDPGKLVALHDFVIGLRETGTPVKSPRQLHALDEAKRPRSGRAKRSTSRRS